MKEVTILWTRYSDWISSLVYHLAGSGYTHASLGLEEEQGIYYSFNYRGFCVETLEKHRRRGVRQSMSCVLQVPDEAYQRIRDQLEGFKLHRSEYRYTRLGVTFCLMQIPFLWRKHYFCSQFVAELLKKAEALPLAKRAELYLPNQLWDELTASRQAVRLQRDPV